MTSTQRGTSELEFWRRPIAGPQSVAVIDGSTGESLTYAQLSDRVDGAADLLGADAPKMLALLRAGNDLDSLLCYLTLTACGHVVWLWPPNRLGKSDIALIEQYQPEMVLNHPSIESQLAATDYPDKRTLFGYALHKRAASGGVIHSDLALLMSTSGSTSSPKLARLSYKGIATNARQIVDALRIRPEEHWLASLPFNYVFGLSVINSALCAGATLVLGDRTVMQKSFWELCKTHGITSIAVVPSQLKVMHDIKLDVESLGPIRKIAVAGGATSAALRSWLAQDIVRGGVEVYSMYGQTEASGRISVLASEEFAQHNDSVGRAVAGGSLRILPSGEVEYSGANVMMGYATSRAHLECPDELGGVLNTRDLGRLDASGRLHLFGRTSRICKLFGVRIDLDDVETLCASIAPVAAICDDRLLYVFHEHSGADLVDECMRHLAEHLRMPVVAMVARKIEAIPQTLNGKTHYAALSNLLGS